MSEVTWCEGCRMRVGIDVDCDVEGHVHRPLRRHVADDIVQELDDWAHVVDKSQGRATVTMLSSALFRDAADHIVRLRREVDLKGGRLDDALDEIERLRTEVARLGAFLHPIGEDARRG